MTRLVDSRKKAQVCVELREDGSSQLESVFGEGVSMALLTPRSTHSHCITAYADSSEEGEHLHDSPGMVGLSRRLGKMNAYL